jgi:hypothetical protein
MTAEIHMPAPDDRVDEVAGRPFTPAETASAVGLGVIALLIAGLFGLLFPALAQEGRISTSGIGLAAMFEALSCGLVAGAAGIVIKPRGLRAWGAVATLGVIALDLVTLRASGSGPVLAVRLLAGVPEGVLLWISIGLISRTQTPERWSGALFTGMGVTQLAAATGISAFVLPRWGANGGFATVAAAMALAFLFVPFLPRAYGAAPGQEPGGGGAPPLRGWIALVGTLLFAGGLNGVAVYLIPLAQTAGLGVETGRTAISAALACNIAGGALATALAGRARWIVVFLATTVAIAAAWAVYASHPPAWLFVAAAGTAGLAAFVANPFLVPMTVEADPSRRAAAQSGPVQLLAGAFGPFAAALVVRGRDASGVLVLGAGLLLAGLALIVLVHRLSAKDRAAA